jgi:hypothetical protein
MSWLYEHRDQLNGLRSFAEIAYRITYGIPPDDRDDVEQDIVIALMRVSQRNANSAYLWGVARKELAKYWHKKCYLNRMFRPFYEGEVFTSHDRDNAARLDAIAILATLPERLVRIGYDRLDGKKLSESDRSYWQRHRAKLDCRHNAQEISDWERKRILRLHDQGFSVYKIRKATGRCCETIQRAIRESTVGSK